MQGSMSFLTFTNMTKYLEECLAYLNEKWQGKEFTASDVFPWITRGQYNLDRLEALGKLKSRIKLEGTAPLIWPRKYYSLIS